MGEAVTQLDRRLVARDLDALPHEWDTRYDVLATPLVPNWTGIQVAELVD